MATNVLPEHVKSFHPGTALADLMVIHKLKLADVADATGASEESLQSLLDCEVAISDELVVDLAKMFMEPEEFWRNSQIAYERDVAEELERQEAATELLLLERFRIEEAVALGWIPYSSDARDGVLAVRNFLGLDLLADFEPPAANGYRITGARDACSPEALGMWLRQGESEAAERSVPEFDAEAFRRVLGDVRLSTRRTPFAFLPRIEALCAEAGVVFVVVEDLPGASVRGATRWREDGTPWIQINFKDGWVESFWFAFYHEAAHVLQGRRRDVIHLEGESLSGDLSEDDLLDESEVEQIAADALISPTDWYVIGRIDPLSARKLKFQADRIGVHLGIIVARLQREGRLPRDSAAWNRHKTRVALTERKGLASLSVKASRVADGSASAGV